MRTAAFIALALLLGSAPSRADTRRRHSPELYPLKPGTRWVYLIHGSECVCTVSGTQLIDGVPCTVLEYAFGGRLFRIEYIRRDPAGYSMYVRCPSDLLSKTRGPYMILRLPPSSGRDETWMGEQSGHEYRGRYSDLGEEAIEVFGRRTACRKVRGAGRKEGRGTLEETRWFAPEIGLVRLEWKCEMWGTSSRTEMTLKSFSPGR